MLESICGAATFTPIPYTTLFRSFQNGGHTRLLGDIDKRIRDVALFIRGCGHDDRLATRKLSRDAQHHGRGWQGSCSSGNIESDTLYRPGHPPANNTRHGFHYQFSLQLLFVEAENILKCLIDRFFQLRLQGDFDLLRRNDKWRGFRPVEPAGILYNGSIPPLPDIFDDRLNGFYQVSVTDPGAPAKRIQFFGCQIPVVKCVHYL